MNYVIEMALGGMTYIPSLIKIGLGVRKLLGGDTHTDIHTQTGG
jgi:hypothetical protein